MQIGGDQPQFQQDKGRH